MTIRDVTSSEFTTVKPPAGNEAFCFLATRNPVDFLSGADTLRETAGVANLELNPARFFQRLDDAVP